MLHIRYDWRRPVFWVAVSITFFPGLHTTSVGSNSTHSNKLVKGAAGAGSMIANVAEQRLYESRLSIYFYITKR